MKMTSINGKDSIRQEITLVKRRKTCRFIVSSCPSYLTLSKSWLITFTSVLWISKGGRRFCKVISWREISTFCDKFSLMTSNAKTTNWEKLIPTKLHSSIKEKKVLYHKKAYCEYNRKPTLLVLILFYSEKVSNYKKINICVLMLIFSKTNILFK
jgi:hypothetical protein